MPKIRLILEDNDAVIIDKSFPLPDNLDNLDELDEAVEGFKNVALPQIEKEIFQKAQDRKVAELKKTESDP